jgi:hypothetical protein
VRACACARGTRVCSFEPKSALACGRVHVLACACARRSREHACVFPTRNSTSAVPVQSSDRSTVSLCQSAAPASAGACAVPQTTSDTVTHGRACRVSASMVCSIYWGMHASRVHAGGIVQCSSCLMRRGQQQLACVSVGRGRARSERWDVNHQLTAVVVLFSSPPSLFHPL